MLFYVWFMLLHFSACFLFWWRWRCHSSTLQLRWTMHYHRYIPSQSIIGHSFMFKNKLTNLPADAFTRLPSLKRLRLEDNPIDCNCGVYSLWRYYQQHPQRKAITIALTCETPASLYRYGFNGLQGSHFHCSKYIMYIRSYHLHWISTYTMCTHRHIFTKEMRFHFCNFENLYNLKLIWHEEDDFKITSYQVTVHSSLVHSFCLKV